MKLDVVVSGFCSRAKSQSKVLTTAVLGPMVYAAAYCPLSFKSTLEGLGFDGWLLLDNVRIYSDNQTRKLSPQKLVRAYGTRSQYILSCATLRPIFRLKLSLQAC